jgi:hypothetical protein
LLDALLAPPALWAPYPAGVTLLTGQQHAQYSRIGIKRGFPDLMIFYGCVYGIELKRRRGQLSKTKIVHTRRGSPRELIGQEDMFPKLIASGAFGAIEVARSVEDLCALLDRWNIPRLGGGSWQRLVSAKPPAGISARPALEGGGSA